jgi:hypothetical protein
VPPVVREGSLWEGERFTRRVHYANRDYGNARRVMHRIALRGDEPVGVDVLR